MFKDSLRSTKEDVSRGLSQLFRNRNDRESKFIIPHAAGESFRAPSVLVPFFAVLSNKQLGSRLVLKGIAQ